MAAPILRLDSPEATHRTLMEGWVMGLRLVVGYRLNFRGIGEQT